MGDLRAFLRFFAYIFIPVIVALGTFQFLDYAFFQPIDSNDRQARLVEISSEDFSEIAALLQKQGLVRFARTLEVLARLSDDSKAIKLGEYSLAPSMTPQQILDRLYSGKRHQRKIFIQAGDSIWEIGEQFQKAGIINGQDFTDAAVKPSLLVKAGLRSSSFEGFLGLGEYSFARPIKSEDVVWEMMRRAENEWKPEYSEIAESLNLSRMEILTIASLIQKDCVYQADYEKYSSVLHNRLAQTMRLDSEGSVRYGMSEPPKVLSQEDLDNPHPYNTFVNFGLPPGPIANPGPEAIDAALNPEATSYLFAGQNEAGRMFFASTKQEFENLLRKYRPDIIEREKAAEAAKQAILP